MNTDLNLFKDRNNSWKHAGLCWCFQQGRLCRTLWQWTGLFTSILQLFLYLSWSCLLVSDPDTVLKHPQFSLHRLVWMNLSTSREHFKVRCCAGDGGEMFTERLVMTSSYLPLQLHAPSSLPTSTRPSLFILRRTASGLQNIINHAGKINEEMGWCIFRPEVSWTCLSLS